MVRRERDAADLEAMGAVAVQGDVRDAASVARLVGGAEVVHHLAAWMGVPPRREAAHATNVEGTRLVVAEAAAAGARRVVLASSIAVYGPIRDGIADEERDPWSVGDHYGDSKAEAERVAREVARRVGIELVILRPTMIYGPGSPSWTTAPFRAVRRGLPVVIGDGLDLLDAVYVDDVARAFVLAGSSRAAAGETLNVGGAAVTWNDFMGAYASMAGRPLRRVPSRLAWEGARLVAAVTRPLLGRPALIPEQLGVMTSRATFPHDRAGRVLGYAPVIGLEEGMRRTERWLRRAGLLRRPRVALVTGAGSGLGRSVARALAERGLVVYAADVDAAALEPLATLGLRTLAFDLASAEGVERAIAGLSGDEAVDLLVNVAGILKPGALETQPMRDVELQIAVNALGPLRLARAVAPGMRRRGYGRIVNVSSTNGFLVTPFMGAYSASKFALEALSDALRLELAPWGVEVGVVHPGAMRTPFAGRAKDALRGEIASASDWAGHLEVFLNGSLWGGATAASPDAVARRLVDAALARRLRARSYVTADAVPTRVLAMLPDVVKDAFFSRVAGLRRRRT